MSRNCVIACAILGFVAFAGEAQGSLMAYLYVKGQKTGPVKGGITQKGREDSIGVIAFEQESTVDLAPGAATGKPRVGQIVITKELDRSSPILRQMLDGQEVITDATIRFWTPQIRASSGVGSEVQHYTVRLTNARIVSMKTVMANIRNPDLMKTETYEVISFTYEKAEWTWNDGGITTIESNGVAPPRTAKE